MNLKVRLHLASGQTVETEALDADVSSEDEYLEDLEDNLKGDARPGWRQIENVLVFSQALSAIEVEEITSPKGR